MNELSRIPFETPSVETLAGRLAFVATTLREGGFGSFVAWSDGDQHIVAAGAKAGIVLDGATLTMTRGSSTILARATTRDPFIDAPRLLKEHVGGPFRAWGYLGFGLATFRYGYRKSGAPSLHLIVPEVTCRIDAAAPHVELEGDADAVVRARSALATAAATGRDGRSRGSPPPDAAGFADVVASGRVEYERAVETVLGAIRGRTVEKVILSRRVALPGRLDALSTLAALGTTHATRRYAFALGDVVGVGACPEILLVADDEGRVVTNPLAGTQPRGATDGEDARLRANLLSDAKEVSEHAMSILLAYEELASVCSPETLRVIDFMRVKQYPFTQHLSSRAAGTITQGRTTWDALQAVFPGVTVTGIAKAPALELIDALEVEPRGVYGGAVGWVDDRDAMDWGIAIRSVFDYGSGAILNAGAGIVRDSDPSYEFDESAHKMKTMASKVVLMPELEGGGREGPQRT